MEAHMTQTAGLSDPSTWDLALDAVAAAPKHHKVLFENDRLRVLEVTLEPEDGKGSLVVHMAPQPAGRVYNASGKTIHGIRIEMKTA
jgi:predicted RNA-binding protein YlqC (UPF0109 family)